METPIKECLKEPLVELPINEWSGLINLYQGTEGLTARTVLRNQLYEKEKNGADFKNKVYVISGQKELGFIAMWHFFANILSYGVFPLNNSMRLIEALQNTKLLDWKTSPFVFSSIIPILWEPMKDMLNKSNITFMEENTIIYHFPSEKVTEIELEVPDDIVVKKVEPNFANEINSAWEYRITGSEEHFERRLQLNDTIGVYGKHENDLRGWILVNNMGDMHSLHVKEEHRQKGYAQLLVKAMSKKIFDRKNEIHANIVLTNLPSKSLFQKLGFDILTEVKWFWFVPK